MVIRWKYVMEGLILGLIAGIFINFFFGIIGVLFIYFIGAYYAGSKVGGGRLNGAINGIMVGILGLGLLALLSSIDIGPFSESGFVAALWVLSVIGIFLGTIEGALGAGSKKSEETKATTVNNNQSENNSAKNQIPPTQANKGVSGDYQTVEMGDYAGYIYKLAGDLNISNIDELYNRHTASCANCGAEFSKETLQQLAVFGPKSDFNNSGSKPLVIGTSTQGEAIRRGRCPYCNHNKINISMK